MLFIFSTSELIRNLWQLKTAVFLHWCLLRAVPFLKFQRVQNFAEDFEKRQKHVFILFTFVQTNWTKFMPTFVKTFNKIWWESLKDFMNSLFPYRPNLLPTDLVHEQNHLHCMNIAVTYLTMCC